MKIPEKSAEETVKELDYIHTEWGDTVHVEDVIKLIQTERQRCDEKLPTISICHKDGVAADSPYRIYKNGELANTDGKWETLVLNNEALTQPQ